MMNTQQSDCPISPLNKGLGFFGRELGSAEIAALNWNLLREDLSLPAAVLYQERLQHNLDWMQEFISAYGMKLAPHGKTTMAPKLHAMQIQKGAWGITLATAHQTFVAWSHGIRRVLMANQLVGRENMALISRLLDDPQFEYYCLVDSAEGVHQLGRFFAERSQQLRVLLEIGVAGGRTGVRTEEQLAAVLEALQQWRNSLALSGVEFYEGILDQEAAVRAFLGRVVDITTRLVADDRFDRRPPLISGAGSVWYDVVAEVLSGAAFSKPVDIVLRPGCYLTHDGGFYRDAQARILERNPVARRMHSGLQPALQVWAYVQSIPEDEKAIVGLGKRDASFDLSLPIPALQFRPGEKTPKAAPAHWVVTKLMDQHAYLQVRKGDDVRVGDMIGFDISHPCLTFDRWRVIPIVNAEFQIVDLVQTFF